MTGDKKNALAVQAISALIDSASRMPVPEQLESAGGGRAVYRWISGLAVLYNEEQRKGIAIGTGRTFLKEMESAKTSLLVLMKRILPAEGTAHKILTAYEIAIRRLVGNWVMKTESGNSDRDALLRYYYSISVKTIAGMHYELLKTSTSEVKVPLEGKKGQFETKKVTNVILPVISSNAPLGVKERAMIGELNSQIKATLMTKDDVLDQFIEPGSSSKTELDSCRRRVEAAYALAKRCNDCMRFRRGEALSWTQANHGSSLANVKTNPSNPKETHDLFAVVQPLWEKNFPNESSLCEDFDRIFSHGEGLGQMSVHDFIWRY